MEFNTRSRKLNAMLASSSGVFQQLIQIIGNFGYRTIFLMVFSKEYLGINGLFTNILQLFSITELGIGTAILYSMYKPFTEYDSKKISALVRFYKRVYYMVAGVVLVLGLSFYPFIESLVDISEVPADVNLRVVYLLFVLESVAGYLVAYRFSILQADQRLHVTTLFNCGQLLFGYAVRASVLLLTRDYETVLLAGILSDVLLNWLFSRWIVHKYAFILKETGEVTREEKNTIYKNTFALLCHKIGSIVVTSTDNIILTKYVSLVATGMYSNYSTIVLAITNIANRVFSGILPSVTNYTISNEKQETYQLFKRILFGNLWISSFTTVCLYVLLNPFIELWLDESFLFEGSVVAAICLQHYLSVSRLTANIFVNSTGLFSRDKIRPLIESTINLTVSIVLVKKIGIVGVFVGTCVSGMLTYYWREPYLVFKNFFGKGIGRYWAAQGAWLVLTLVICWGLASICALLPNTLFAFVVKMLIAGLGSNAIILLCTFWTDEWKYFLGLVMRKIK